MVRKGWHVCTLSRWKMWIKNNNIILVLNYTSGCGSNWAVYETWFYYIGTFTTINSYRYFICTFTTINSYRYFICTFSTIYYNLVLLYTYIWQNSLQYHNNHTDTLYFTLNITNQPKNYKGYICLYYKQ